MAKRSKPKVYLAGPISGCNPDQITHWRARIKDRWGREFEFIDPADDLVGKGLSSYEIVRRDHEAIRKVDGVLANMWRESIGTAIGIAHARHRAKPLVVVDPNRLNSRTLAYYADAIVETPDEGMRTLRSLLREQERLRVVIKRDGSQEPFDRAKLVQSLREACRAAGCNDVLVPAETVPRVMNTLAESDRIIRAEVPTQEITDAVWKVLADLEADPLRQDEFAGIREVWERYDRGRRESPVPTRALPAPTVQRRALKVDVSSAKAHSTIWGKTVKALSDIPAAPRGIFEEICRVDGIARILLSHMSVGPKVEQARVAIFASKTAGIIEGKCYDNAAKGQIQSFQIHVHDAERTENIRRALVEHLRRQRLLRMVDS